MYKHILVAIDGSELSHRGLLQGIGLARTLGARLDIVTVSEPWAMGMYDTMGWSVGYEASPEYREEREQAAQAVLAPALAEAQAAGVEAASYHVLDRYAAEGILQVAEQCQSDLLVMSSHGRRGMSRVLLGSQTLEVLSGTTIPMLVVR